MRERARQLDPVRRAALARLLAERRTQPDPIAGGSIPRLPRDDDRTFPCSPAQRRIWLAEQIAPDRVSMPNATFGLRLRGPLRPDALERALAAVVERHESMRTLYVAPTPTPDDPHPWPRQRVLPAGAESAPFAVVDLTPLPPTRRESRAQELATTVAAERFDLGRGPLFRVTVFRLAELEHVLLFAGHHIAFDEQSVEIVIRDLASGYTAAISGHAEPVPEPAVQYADYSAWATGAAQSDAVAERLAYWRERLTPAPPELRLPVATDPAGRPEGPSHSVRMRLPTGSVDRLRRAEGGATEFVALLAVFKVLLARYTGGNDITVGTVSAGRGRVELEPVVGCFLNPLVLRTDLAGAASFAEVLGRVRRTVMEGFAREAPFDRIVAEVGAPRRSGGNPLFQVAFEVHGHRADNGDWPALDVEMWHHEVGGDVLDLSVIAMPLPDGGAEVTFRHPAGALETGAVERLADHFGRLVKAFAADPAASPDVVPYMTADEQALLGRWNDTALDVPAETVPELIARQARETPGATAVLAGEEALTYAELMSQVEVLARRLRAAGAGPGSLVGVCLDRSARLVVTMLAVWRTGAAYVPVDPEYPPARQAFVLEDCAAPILVTESALIDRLPPHAATVVLADEPGDAPHGDGDVGVVGDVAYVIYTSGSTGRPKGVAIGHRPLGNFIHDMRLRVGGEPSDRWLAVTSPAFDIAALELYLPLACGGSLVMADEETGRDGAALTALIAEAGVTHVQTTPSRWRLLLAAGFADRAVTALVGGEALPPALARELRERVGHLVNVYGPTETTIWSTAWQVPEQPGEVLIGTPIANTQIHICDENGRPQPIGIPGELCIGGLGVAQGYLGRPALTADRFRPDLLGPSGARVYRTGDLARWRGDGQLEFLGRADNQIKLHGHRIEPGEIEAWLSGLPGVAEAAVVVWNLRGWPSLAAYLSLEPDASPDPAGWRAELARNLPRYMVPDHYTVLPRLPLTPNGKLDRSALPAPDDDGPAAGEHVEPRTPAEELVARVWAEVLEVERVGAGDDFFALGGHSLLAMTVAARLSEETGREVLPGLLFRHPSVAELAAALDELPYRTGAQAEDTADTPLSFGQERLWFLNRLDPEDASYNMYLVYRLRGPLDAGVLQRALSAVVNRHDALRTRYVAEDGEPSQVVEPADGLILTCVDAVSEEQARAQVTAWTNAPFDLATELPVRAGLIRLGAAGDLNDHVFCLVVQHIAGDGRSLGLVMEELYAAYQAFAAGEPLTLPELPHRYADFAVRQRERAAGDDDALDYWRTQLAGVATLELPADRPRPAVKSGRGGFVRHRLPGELATSLERLATGQRGTLFMVLLAGFQALLGRHAGQDDVCVGSTISGRTPGFENVVGMFVNTLALRGDLSGDPTFRELLGRTRETALAAYFHQDIPFERLTTELNLVRDLSRTPLFQTMLILHSEQGAGTQALPGVSAEFFDDGFAQAKFDLLADMWREPDGIDLSFNYSADIFDAPTVAALARRFEALLTAVVADPDLRLSQIDLLVPQERDEALALGIGAAGPGPRDVVDLIAAADPDAVAVVCGHRRLTYGELEQRAEALAGRLSGHLDGPDRAVAVALPRSPELIVALLAVLKAGGAYVPVDLDYPAARVEFMLRDSAPAVLLTESSLRERLPATSAAVVCVDEQGQAPVRPRSPADLAYVIYTSGSTGTPKGVGISRGALAARVAWMRTRYALSESDQVVQFASVSFDTHVEEIWPTLCSGARLVLLPPGEQLPDLLTAPAGADVTVLDLPTPYWHELVGQLEQVRWPASLRLLILGADQVRGEALARWRARFGDRVEVLNTYGPTETTVIATAARLGEADTGGRPPIGSPIDDTSVYVVDDRLRLLPPGVPGELCIAGDAVARGYLGRPGLTADRFQPDPYGPPGTRLYRTGDRARWRADGQLEFLGRLDDQVKIRGYRVEPGEVATALNALPGVRQAAVVARPDPAGHLTLVGYAAGDGLSAAELRTELARRLPAFLVPSHLIVLAQIPLTANGKVDRDALPAPGSQPREGGYVPVRTPAEALVAEVWAGVLGRERVGASDDFFALGGHSLVAMQVIARLRAATGRTVPIQALFEHPTVAGLAAVVDTLPTGDDDELTWLPPDAEAAPLTFGQERLWFLNRLNPDDTSHNIYLAYRLRGPLDADVLERAIGTIVDRHDALRTRYTVDDEGTALQVPAPPCGLPLERVRVPDGAADPVAWAHARIGEWLNAPFDLTTGPLIRAGLVRLDSDDHVLCLTLHHIAGDGRSSGLIVSELRACYAAYLEGAKPVLPELPMRYADYAAWQRSRAEAGASGDAAAYWRAQLAGVAALDLPTDRPWPAVQGTDGDFLDVHVPRRLDIELRRIAADTRCTPFMLLLAAYQVLLSRFTGQHDICVGAPIEHRPRVEVADLVGFFVNTLAMRGDLSGDPTFRELLARTRDTALAAYAFPDVPFHELLRDPEIPRYPGRAPVFQTMFALHTEELAGSDVLPGVTAEFFDGGLLQVKFDLSLDVWEDDRGMRATFGYRGELFERATIARLADWFLTLLAALAAAPDDPLSMVDADDEEERAKLRSGTRVAAVAPVAVPAHAYVAPRTEAEIVVARIWAEVLGVERVGAYDDFFALGGHSLLAMKAIARLRAATGVEVPLRAMFSDPTVELFAAVLEDGAPSSGHTIAVRADEGPPPLSFAQERLWFMEQLAPGSGAYTIAAVLRLRGELDVAALTTAFNGVVARHETLRSRFEDTGDGRPVLVIDPPTARELPVVPTTGAGAHDLVQAHLAEPIDLATGPLLRPLLLRLETGDHLLALAVHHIAADGWAMDLFAAELSALYADRSALPDLPVRYGDYAAWQRSRLSGPAKDADLAYWREALADLEPLDLPTDHPRPARQTFGGAAHTIALDAGLRAGLAELGQAHGATLYMVLLAAVHAVLGRHSGQRDFAVGSPVAGRLHPELEKIVGTFVNMLTMRAALDGDPGFAELLARTRERCLEAYAHQELPFEQLVQELNVARDVRRSPLFQVMFAVQNYGVTQPAVPGGLTIDGWPTPVGTTRFDLEIYAYESGDGLAATFVYNTDLFAAETVERLAGHLRAFLDAVVADPGRPLSEVSLLSTAEEAELVAHSPAVDFPADATLPSLIAETARRIPDSVAVTFEGRHLTYAELDERAAALAGRLSALRVGPGDLVAVCAERSLELVVALYAVLRTGAAYLPLDPEYPADRLAFMLADSGAPVLLAQRGLVGRLPASDATVLVLEDAVLEDSVLEDASDDPLDEVIRPSDVAYVIYTSGSTGRPKGVPNTHSGIVNRLDWMQRAFRLGPDDVVLQKTPAGFDVSVWEFFWPLIAGARLVLAKPAGHRDAEYLRDLIRAERVTTVHFVPSMLAVFLAAEDVAQCTSLRRVVCSGEELPVDLADRCVATLPAELHNLYGPTEAAVDVSAWHCRPDELAGLARVPIGVPIQNTALYVLDERLRPVPVGVPGELFIAGAGLARGYLNRPALTAGRFRPDPFGPAGSRMYATGDLARRRADGALEFLGRLDDQVKLRGLRIELGEIGAVLREQAGVRDAAVIVREDRLVAYVIGDAEHGALRAALRARLPDYMIPAAFVTLDELPLLPNGKLARRSLPAPAAHRSDPGAVAPRTDTERLIAGIWRELLNVETVGIDDDFFDLGGHSLLATQVVAKLRHASPAGVSVLELFQHRTIRALAELIDTPADRRGPRRLLHELTSPGRERTATLVCVPYGGGSAVVYQPLADALPSGWSLYAVSVPGQDIGVDEEALPFDELAERCAAEVLERVDGPLVLYSHCVGSALMVEIARRVEAAGREIDAVYLGANFPFARPTKGVMGALSRLARRDRLQGNRVYENWLRSMGVDLADLDPAEADRIVRTMRDQARAAEDYFTRLFSERVAPLRAPIISVIGERDSETEFYRERYREWNFLAHETALVVLDEGGHYFLKYRAAELAAIVTDVHTTDRPLADPDGGWSVEGRTTTEKPTGVAAQPSMRRFLLVALGQLVSMVGSALTEFAIPLWIYLQTGSVVRFAVFAVLGLVPGMLVAPIAGAVVDRFDRRRVMLLGDLAAGGSQAVLLGLALTDRLEVGHIYVLLVVLSVALTFQRLAYASAVPQLVPKRYLGHANGVVQMTQSAGQFAVPIAAAGLMAAVGLRGVLLLDVVSYLFAVGVTLLIRFPDTLPWQRRESLVSEIAAGWRYALGDGGLRPVLVFFAVLNLFMTPLFLLISPLVLSFADLGAVARVSMATGLGGILAGVLMSLWGGPRTARVRVMIWVVLLLAVFSVLPGLRPNEVLVAVGAFGMFFCLTLANGIYSTLVQVKVPQRFHGRVFAVNTVIAFSTIPIGYAVIAPLGSHVLGTPLLFPILAAAMAIQALICLRLPRLVRFDERVPDALPDDLVGVRTREMKVRTDVS
ncbi:amino acid adenylation domain-containing protein [Streptosporangiaceae bacterium NEAU-GS5]|nr:amino acid adenylation domain-containing protein [Streptosporangiaceae bacterium NEAU-GS5]